MTPRERPISKRLRDGASAFIDNEGLISVSKADPRISLFPPEEVRAAELAIGNRKTRRRLAKTMAKR